MYKVMQVYVFNKLFVFLESPHEDHEDVFNNFGNSLINMLEKPESKSEEII